MNDFPPPRTIQKVTAAKLRDRAFLLERMRHKMLRHFSKLYSPQDYSFQTGYHAALRDIKQETDRIDRQLARMINQ